MPLILTISDLTLADTDPGTSSVSDLAVFTGSLGDLPVSEEFLASADFEGKPGQTLLISTADGPLVLVGMGNPDDLDESGLRLAAGSLRRAASGFASLTTTLADVTAEALGAEAAADAVVQGVLLSSYRFEQHRGDPPDADSLRSVVVVSVVDRSIAERSALVAEGVALARDLVNQPGGSLRAVDLANAAEAACQAAGVSIEVWDLDRCREERLGGILSVNAGSTNEPRLIQMTYEPEGGSDRTVVLVGKGITFDTGGLSLKSGEGMMTMKKDMGGAAAVIGTMRAIQAVSPSVRVVGICCCTDNQPGPDATMPGDVFTARNGTTVEVLNTDAEGRLVLADGLSLAAELEPAAIVDVATLTGACMVALGEEIGGLMGNNDGVVERIKAAAASVGDAVWHLPLPERYRKQLDSPVADLKNIGAGRYGGTLTAGLFLKEFVGDHPWAHLDVPGPVSTDKAKGELTRGATGFPVRTLLQFVADF